jgi:hypothetical protein
MSKFKPVGDEKIVYQGKMLEIVNQAMKAGSKSVTFEWARRAPGVRLIIVDTDKKTVLLTKEHRYELDADDFRLPGGKVFDSLQEYNDFLRVNRDIIEPATKKATAEALEEAGVRIEEAKHIHTSVCGATVQWDLLFFVSTKWDKVNQQLEEGEVISTIEVSFEEAKKIAVDGRMSEERSALILLRYLSSEA